MAKLRNRQTFKAVVNGKEYNFTCYSQNTSYGFRHICTLGVNNTTECKYIKKDIISKSCYYNRTWERFQFETVLRNGIQKLNESKEVKQALTDILIDGKAQAEHERVEKEISEFKTLWSGLTDENKQHIKNGLGDNLITSTEQANAVVGVMKMMTLFQSV